MKILAARERDIADIRLLVEHLGLTSADQALAVCSEVFPNEQIPDRARMALEDVFEDQAAGQDPDA